MSTEQAPITVESPTLRAAGELVDAARQMLDSTELTLGQRDIAEMILGMASGLARELKLIDSMTDEQKDAP